MGAGAGGQAGSRVAKSIIAAFNSSNDTVALLQAMLEQEGFRVVVGHIPDVKSGELDFVAFIELHTPAVIVYDVSLPYEANWNFLRLVRSSEPVKVRGFVSIRCFRVRVSTSGRQQARPKPQRNVSRLL